MGDNNIADRRSVIAKRVEFIDLLNEEGPLPTRDIVDGLDHSRSTVTRALRELRDADLVEKGEVGYAAKLSGIMAAQEYRRYEAASTAIFKSKELLEPIPEHHSPPAELLMGAESYTASEEAPFRPLEAVAERVREADVVEAYLPTLVNPHLLRLWHRQVVSDGVAGEAIFDPNLLAVLKGQYPELLAEMATAKEFAAAAGADHPYAILLTVSEDTTTGSVIVYENDTAVRGVIMNDSDAAVDWARTQLERVKQDAADVTDDLTALHAATDTEIAGSRFAGRNRDTHPQIERDGGFAGHAVPVNLESEGFVRLSEEYFSSHQRVSPEVSWRTGFTLAEIRAGHAVDRQFTDGTRESVTSTLVDNLRDGTDHVVLGPAGAGKSTVCMSVACEWYDRQFGPVLYRERGSGNEFDSPALLEAYLREIDEHVLVVVEDAIRNEANIILEVMQRLNEYSDVTFLLDSRTVEWDDPVEFDVDPRLDGYRRESIERVSVPALDETECERFTDHYGSLVSHEFDVSGEALASAIGNGRSGNDADHPTPGEALLAQHHLSQRGNPPTDTGVSSTTALEAETRRMYRSLIDDDEHFAADLTILVNLLNAAGIPVAREYLYALGSEDEDGKLQESISLLEGRLLFHRKRLSGQTTEYRTHHETWSRRFLEQIPEVIPKHRAREAFNRCVTRLLSLADDADRRKQIERRILETTPHLHRIEADPQRWADEAVERIFTLGEAHATLTPLFGTSDDGFSLPASCSSNIRHKQYYWRAKMHQKQGNLDQSVRELEQLQAVVATGNNPCEQSTVLQMQYHRERGIGYSFRGEFDSAEVEFERFRELADELGNDVAKTRARIFKVGFVDVFRGTYDTATEEIEELREAVIANNNPDLKALMFHLLGYVDLERGRIERGIERTETVLDLAEQYTFRDDITEMFVTSSLINVGHFALSRNDFEAAESYFSRAYSKASDEGVAQAKEVVILNLGEIARLRGEMADAEQYYRQAHELAKTNQTQRWIGGSLNKLAQVEFDQGNDGAAIEYARDAIDVNETANYYLGLSDAHRIHGQIALQRGNMDIAEEQLKQACEAARSIESQQAIARAKYQSARLALKRGEKETAEERVKDALEVFSEMERSHRTSSCLRLLGLIALHRDEKAVAAEHLTEALDHAQESEVVRVIAESHEALSRLRARTREYDYARRHLENAAIRYEELDNSKRVREMLETLIPLHSNGDADNYSLLLDMIHEIAERNHLESIVETVTSTQVGQAD